MDTAMTRNWLDLRRTPPARSSSDEQSHLQRLIRENEWMSKENERLREAYTDLAESAEIWIRLYEAALARANAATLP